jgi:putative Holliday junction resolvase
MRILALDYGSARIGCALSDPTGTVVRPIEVIEPPDPSAVARLVVREDVERVVVGLPVNMDGTEGAQAVLTRSFCAALQTGIEVPVEAYDERLTTKMAQATRRSGAQAAEDSLAAAHLLEDYLAAHPGRGA